MVYCGIAAYLINCVKLDGRRPVRCYGIVADDGFAVLVITTGAWTAADHARDMAAGLR